MRRKLLICYADLSAFPQILTTSFGLSILLSESGMASIKVTPNMRGQVFGMCGTCNVNAGDDLTMQSGAVVSFVLHFTKKSGSDF